MTQVVYNIYLTKTKQHTKIKFRLLYEEVQQYFPIACRRNDVTLDDGHYEYNYW
jgi:hypothetical protein